MNARADYMYWLKLQPENKQKNINRIFKNILKNNQYLYINAPDKRRRDAQTSILRHLEETIKYLIAQGEISTAENVRHVYDKAKESAFTKSEVLLSVRHDLASMLNMSDSEFNKISKILLEAFKEECELIQAQNLSIKPPSYLDMNFDPSDYYSNKD